MRKLLITLIAVATAVAAVAFVQMSPTKTGDSAKGKVLTNESGMTLYVFDKDSDGKSACNGPCTGNWPPLMATAASMPVGLYKPTACFALHLEERQEAWRYLG
jgi:predicted lipoprotein with Yx(FWY)xxD motif